MASHPPIRIGLTGLGGYAGFICDRLLDEAQSDAPAAQFVAVCDPALERFGARVRELNAKGVQTLRSYDQLLAAGVEAVWLPLPIDLHRPYTEAALAAGKAVMCEKPAAGSIDDVDAMLAARDRAKLPVAIGFQDIYQPMVATLKRRFLAGEFGKPIAATIIGCWPRSERYFGRNDWAGRFKRDHRWVMDSPASNALAHFINLAMFLMGPTEQASALPTHIAAELYRANRIENFDTCSLCLTIDNSVPLYVAYTHACSISVDPIVTIETEKSVIRYVAGRHIEIRPTSDLDVAEVETLPLVPHPHSHMLRAFQSCVRDPQSKSLCATLEMARQHVMALNVASETSPIIDIPPAHIDIVPGPDHAPLRSVHDIVPALQACIARKCMLSQTSLAPWAIRAATTAIPPNYHHFAGPSSPRLAVTTHLPHPRRMTMPAVN